MLVLGRKVGETIQIGDDIRLVIVDLRGGQVRLGFDAPREVPIRRSEIVHRYRGEADITEMGTAVSEPQDLQEAAVS